MSEHTYLTYCQCYKNVTFHKTSRKMKYSSKCAPTWQTDPTRKLIHPLATENWHKRAYSLPLADICQFPRRDFLVYRRHTMQLSFAGQQRCTPEIFILYCFSDNQPSKTSLFPASTTQNASSTLDQSTSSKTVCTVTHMLLLGEKIFFWVKKII